MTTDDPEPAPRRRRRWPRVLALGGAVLVLSVAGAGWWFYEHLDGNIRTDTRTANELKKYEAERPVSVVRDAQNILLIGSDNRGGEGNGAYGRDTGTQRSDTTILLHLQAGGKSATAVSIPRDLMVDVPACDGPDGKRTQPRFAQFNWAFEFGGAACTIRTVEKLTGIRIDHHVIVDFNGFKRLVNAVGGVEMCLKEPVDDADAHLKLPAGRQVLRGEQALGYVRARYSIGDGSDTERIGRQQEFMASLVKKMQSNGVLLNPAKLYPVLNAATSSLTTDPGLDSLKDLYALVRGVRDIPREKIHFLTIPRQPYTYNKNRDELVQPDADRLFRQLRLDRPVSVARTVTASTSGDPKAGDGSPYQGTTAARGICE
ncbi:LCP family protein [Streptomyces sp. NPDC044780]|uniref:LCP family protein n=1 Tax=Streptomyces luomodiensis TaxID=3026192 RepID=A0ABY9UWT3_9ACTN|nr:MULTISPECIES: LCP family protein [unclassified Streptomyces]WAP56442.1 LCP family protein [Streptomyces sp. S465]WNE96988.1 LCP family protein [Streptomyces sp. SCA4-21]